MSRHSPYVRLSVPEDVEALIPNIPDEDNVDVINGWGRPSADMLREIFPQCDECFTIINDGAVVGLFGVLPDGNIWLMRGRGIDSVAIRFCRHGHEYIKQWLDKYGTLTGYINKRYRKFVRWLTWEGFEMFEVGRGYLMVRKNGAYAPPRR